MHDLDEVEIRFWEKVDKRGPSECWLWCGSLDRDGYGRQRVGNRPRLAHRVSYALAHGDVPDGAVVMHSCDTPACVNPAHLKAGTQQENIAQREARGRGVRPNGKAKP